MDRALLLLLFVSMQLFAEPELPVFLGVKGKQYDIAEENWFDLIKAAADDMNMTKLKQDQEKAIAAAYKIDLEFPTCTENKQWSISTIKTALDDLYVKGILVVKKGQKVNLLDSYPYGKKIYIFNDNECEQHVLWEKHKDELLALATKADLRLYANELNPPYKASISLLKQYGVTCVPVVLLPAKSRDRLIAHQYTPDDIRSDACKKE